MAFLKKIPKKTIEEFVTGASLENSDVHAEIKKEWSKIVLRISTESLGIIDRLVEKRMGLTRTAWILEAIQEKLNKEQK